LQTKNNETQTIHHSHFEEVMTHSKGSLKSNLIAKSPKTGQNFNTKNE